MCKNTIQQQKPRTITHSTFLLIIKLFSLTEDEFDSILANEKRTRYLNINQDNVMINVMASEKEDRLITTDASKLREYYGDSKQIEREQQRRIAG